MSLRDCKSARFECLPLEETGGDFLERIINVSVTRREKDFIERYRESGDI